MSNQISPPARRGVRRVQSGSKGAGWEDRGPGPTSKLMLFYPHAIFMATRSPCGAGHRAPMGRRVLKTAPLACAPIRQCGTMTGAW